MTTLTTKEKTISWIFQIIAAIILGSAGFSKLSGNEMSAFVFSELGIEETRLIIGVIETLAAFLLITKAPYLGAILGFGTMIGAIIAHVSVLGMEIQNDGGTLVMLLAVLVVATIVIMWIWRRSLPLIGGTFDTK